MFSALQCVYEHRVNPSVSVGACLDYSFVSNYQNFVFGSAHKLDKSSTLKIKVYPRPYPIPDAISNPNPDPNPKNIPNPNPYNPNSNRIPKPNLTRWTRRANWP